jgi:hypothetical protein
MDLSLIKGRLISTPRLRSLLAKIRRVTKGKHTSLFYPSINGIKFIVGLTPSGYTIKLFTFIFVAF